MSATETATRYEVEIDTAIADKIEECGRAYQRILDTIENIHSSAGDRRPRIFGSPVGGAWKMTDEESIAATPPPHYATRHAYAVLSLPLLRDAHEALLAQLKELDDQYTGWQRFFLVTSSDGGHIHSSLHCSTCHPTTQFGWLPQLSGLTEADAVADQGPRLCSVCFPSAPVEWTQGIKIERTYCDGSGQIGEGGWRVKYIACPVCGKTVSKNQYGAIRKHQPEAK